MEKERLQSPNGDLAKQKYNEPESIKKQDNQSADSNQIQKQASSKFSIKSESETRQIWNTNNLSFDDVVEDIVLILQSEKKFIENFVQSSLFLIGHGAFGLIFRAVTQAVGSAENCRYPQSLVRYLQRIRKTSKLTRDALLDVTRDKNCLDLVAIKFEQVSQEDIEYNAVGTIHLIREFYILQHLFSKPDARFSMIGFPLPIDFDYIGNQNISKNLDRVMIYDPFGVPNSFSSTYLDKMSILNLNPDRITDKCYLAMELLGPNIDQWREFFMKSRGRNGSVIFSAQTVLKLMDQVLCRLLVMHRKNVVHLDLKPDNICMGIGKMCNTVYIVDFGLSRICSDAKPNITLGSRRYMSLDVLRKKPTNYMMDIESWFYIFLVLLCDYLPWTDSALSSEFNSENDLTGGALEEKMVEIVGSLKRLFWDDGFHSRRMWIELVKRIELHHKDQVPDIAIIVTEIFDHVRRMRLDFSNVSCLRMFADIRDEESDLFKRYRQLRKLLLYPYDCEFFGKDSCFVNEKDLQRRQNERKNKYKMLIYFDNGRNWHWDWDEWFFQDFENELNNEKANYS